MQYRIFRIPASGDDAVQEDLNRFLRAHRIVSVTKDLVPSSDGASWCFCVEYLIDGSVLIEKQAFDRKIPRIDYKEVLSDTDFAVYAKLREKRKEIAQRDAVQVYTIATNEHLSQMAKGRCKTLADLKKISGFGEAKTTKYGSELLGVIALFNETETEKECVVPET